VLRSISKFVKNLFAPPLSLADLLSKLSGERSRWAQQLAALDGQLAELPRAALAAAAFITYLPAHPEDVRGKVMQGWTRWECCQDSESRVKFACDYSCCL
jgi:hypothetical protein